MKCQSLFSGEKKNKKNISYCFLLNFLPSMLRVNELGHEHVLHGMENVDVHQPARFKYDDALLPSNNPF